MRCPHCNEKTAVHDIWCQNCNKQTDVLANELSAIKSLKATWNEFSKVKGQNYAIGILVTLTGWLPSLLIIWLLNYFLTELPRWQHMLLSNLVWLFFLPVLVLPLSMVSKRDEYVFSTKDIFASVRSYGRYLIFSMASILFYLALFFICKGDPILNLVWLVMVFYWLAIVFPVPVLMERLKLNALQAIKLSYLKAGDVRWNIFLLIIVLFFINIIATGMMLFGLVITLPLTWLVIRDYTDRLIEFEVFGE